MDALSDEVAIEQCRQGDIRGLETLVRRYQVAAVRLAYLLTGNREQAQDIVQESFLQAFHAIHQFRVGQPFAPWYHRIVINLAHAYLRAPGQRRERALDAAHAERPTTDPHAQPDLVAEQGETHRAILAALSELSETHRDVIVLRYYLGYTVGEIASLLHRPNTAVRQRLTAGRKALEAIIRQRYPWLIGEDCSLPALSPSFAEEK